MQPLPYLTLWLTTALEDNDNRADPQSHGYVLSWTARLFLFGGAAKELGKIDEPLVGHEVMLAGGELRFAFRLSLRSTVTSALGRLQGRGPPGQLELRVTMLEKRTGRPVEFVGYFEVGVNRISLEFVQLKFNTLEPVNLKVPYLGSE
ncbi:MAG: hypothetical protein L3K18_03525 [Thermoplasmata archaeon]|nr:hypothetical protein [Thermoplasmata archaeon]